MDSEFSNVKMEIAELRKQIKELKELNDRKEKEINEFDNDLFDARNELLHSQYKHNKATKIINSQVKEIEDFKLKVMVLLLQNNELINQYQELNNQYLKSINQQTKEYQKLNERHNKLRDDIFKFMGELKQ